MNNHCKCPSIANNEFNCPICSKKYSKLKYPVSLKCCHTMCVQCVNLLGQKGGQIINLPLLVFHGIDYDPKLLEEQDLPEDCLTSIHILEEISSLLKNHQFSKQIHRKVIALVLSLSENGQEKMSKICKIIGERALIELSTHSYYQLQQMLWNAMKNRSCHFLGPAMQEETLKLILLALDDGSFISRNVLIMFVVQRISSQFPQASKTSTGQVIQILYRSGCFTIKKREESASLISLKTEYRNYENLRKVHDAQIIEIANESGIRFSPEQWSQVLYGDTNHNSQIQSLLDKIETKDKFEKLLSELLVKITRMDEEEGKPLVTIYPLLRFLIDEPKEIKYDWDFVVKNVDAVYQILKVLANRSQKNYNIK